MHDQIQTINGTFRVGDKVFYGQHQAINLFNRSLSGGRLAHAYLLRGPEGVGKRLFARGLAAAVNCEVADGIIACGKCVSCKKIARDVHPDFTIIADEKGAIKIAQIRELIKALSFAPYEAKIRVTLIEDVHNMRPEAANSLLKTLEEPPRNNLILLTADSSGRVLQTILSRCQGIPFYGLTAEDTSTILLQQDATLDAETAKFLARLSEGSPGKAQLYHKKGLIELWRDLTELLISNSGDENVGELLLMAESMAKLKEDLSYLFSLVKLWLRDCLLEAYGQQMDTTTVNTQKNWNSEQLFAKLQAINQAEKELGRNCNRTLVCEVLLFKLRA